MAVITVVWSGRLLAKVTQVEDCMKHVMSSTSGLEVECVLSS